MAIEHNIPAGECFLASAKIFNLFAKQADDVTPQTMTNWEEAFIIRDEANAVVLSLVTPAITIGDGLGTDDKAVATALAADWSASAVKGWHNYAWWRTDTTNDVLLAYGQIYLGKAAAQP